MATLTVGEWDNLQVFVSGTLLWVGAYLLMRRALRAPGEERLWTEMWLVWWR